MFEQNSQLADECSRLQMTVSENRRKRESGRKWLDSDTFEQVFKKRVKSNPKALNIIQLIYT